MAALSKEEFMELDDQFDENQRTLIKYLAEVRYQNPQNPWVDIETLGAQIGGRTGSVKARIALMRLQHLDLVKEARKQAAISDKGCSYVEFYKIQTGSHFSKKLFFWLLVPLSIGLIVSIRTSNFLIFVLTIVGSFVAGLILFLVTKSQYGKGD